MPQKSTLIKKGARNMAAERLSYRFLNAIWQYRAVFTTDHTDCRVAKIIFRLIRRGRFAKAGKIAQGRDATSAIWGLTLRDDWVQSI